MPLAPWPTSNWPKDVPREISGYEKPVYSILDDSAEKYPDKDYTLFMGGSRTFAQVKDTADRIANFLASRGIGKGDPVAIFLPNLPQYPAVYFGILKAGAICVTCNPMYTASELNYQLKDAEAKAVFCMDHPVYYPTAVEAIKETKVDTVVICGVKSYMPWLKGFFGSLLGKIPKADTHEPEHLFLEDVVSAATPDPPKVTINPTEDLAVIIYTGGTTGVPKGAAITHASFVFNVMALHEWFRIPEVQGGPTVQVSPGGEHCFMAALPFYHSFGMTVIMLWSCFTASRVVCIPDPRAGNPPFTEVLKAIEKHRVTIFPGVPTMFVAVANHPLLDKFDLTSIRGCGSGGAPMPAEVAKQFEEKTGSIIFEAYGLSETSPLATANPCDKETRKFGSVGFPISNTVVAIVDTETGLEMLPQGEDGEIAISGPQVMRGYWQNETANAEVFREIDGKRFFLTGDIGHIDDNGYILITDRKKDLILVGGFNCYPREVEEVLYENPKIANAAVIGIPDPKSGESVKAFVQLKPGEEATEKELLDFCRESLAGYKRPRSIEFRDDLPTSVVGKVLRRVLRDEELAKLSA
ncbi:MAG: long-chain fatty acid--CoA ligase [Desulfobacterales bacterium]